MERDDIARILATHRKELEAFGVRSLALFKLGVPQDLGGGGAQGGP